MSSAAPAIVWFRQDLRTEDHPALSAAAALGRPVIPLYIHDSAGPPRTLGAASAWWLDKSLAALSNDLAALGSPLVLRHGDAARVLRTVIAETGARTVFWNRLYDEGSTARDAAIKSELASHAIDARSFHGALLAEPWTVKTGGGGPYRMFTPYWRAMRAALQVEPPLPAPSSLPPPAVAPRSDPLGAWRLHPTAPDWSGGFSDWRPGQAGARARLAAFLDGAARDYAQGRDRPDRPGTSRLSPHLHFGEISPRQAWAAIERAIHLGEVPAGQAEAFQRELGWREFNHHLLFHFPAMAKSNFNPAFDAFPWREDKAGLRAWRKGRTGYPLVDAGMRELWAAGWMHNRVRMVVASFLVKHLLIHWREGEAWFWDTLADADLANNLAGWQWTAGCGADAAPYFRVFNPVLQGEKFDPAGDYVRRWVPELAALGPGEIHRPWTASSPPPDYPAPIVDHAMARDRALAAYRSMT